MNLFCMKVNQILKNQKFLKNPISLCNNHTKPYTHKKKNKNKQKKRLSRPHTLWITAGLQQSRCLWRIIMFVKYSNKSNTDTKGLNSWIEATTCFSLKRIHRKKTDEVKLTINIRHFDSTINRTCLNVSSVSLHYMTPCFSSKCF